MLGFAVNGVAGLGFLRTVAFVVAPAVLLLVLWAATSYVLRLRRRLDAVSVMAAQTEVFLANHVMFDHIYYAREHGWEVRVTSNGVRFKPPDGREVIIGLYEQNWYRIAQSLHEAAPEHFPEDWMPPNYSNTDLAIRLAMDAKARAKEQAERIDALEARSRPKPGPLASAFRLRADDILEDDRQRTNEGTSRAPE